MIDDNVCDGYSQALRTGWCDEVLTHYCAEEDLPVWVVLDPDWFESYEF